MVESLLDLNFCEKCPFVSIKLDSEFKVYIHNGLLWANASLYVSTFIKHLQIINKTGKIDPNMNPYELVLEQDKFLYWQNNSAAAVH